jgi:hypothetical protein
MGSSVEDKMKGRAPGSTLPPSGGNDLKRKSYSPTFVVPFGPRPFSNWPPNGGRDLPFPMELSELGDNTLRSRDERCGVRSRQSAAVHQRIDPVDEGLEYGDRVRGVIHLQVA